MLGYIVAARERLIRLVGGIGWCCLVAVVIPPAHAVTWQVTTTADEVDAAVGDGLCSTASGSCSLRAAIQESNARPGPDEIVLPAGLYLLSIPPAVGRSDAHGDLDVLDELTLRGAGIGLTQVETDIVTRLLRAEAPLTVEGLALRRGEADHGGCVLAEPSAELVLRDVEIADCVAGRLGGGVAGMMEDDLNARVGPRLVAERSSFLRNLAGVAGDGVNGAGGGVMNWGETEFIACEFIENVALEGGGFAQGPNMLGATTTLTVRGGTFLRNQVDRWCGGLAAKAIRDPTDPTVTMLLEGVVVAENTAGWEVGGVGMLEGGIGIVRDCVIDSNVAGTESAGIGTFHQWCQSDSRLLIERTAITRNVLTSPSTAGIVGGAIWVCRTHLAMVNSTLSGNSEGIYGDASGIHLLNVTITDNGGPDVAHGGVACTSPGGFWMSLAVGNSIVAGNVGAVSDDWFNAPTCQDVNSVGHNLLGSVGTTTFIGPITTDLVGVDPDLEPLADNGSAGLSHLPRATSPALDGGDPAGCSDTVGTLLDDQRGLARPVDGDLDGILRCDIGAIEACSGGDSDGDGRFDGCDCAPLDPGSFGVPEVPLIHVRHGVRSSPTDVTWMDLAPTAGVGVHYEIAGAELAVLHASRMVDGPCLDSVAIPAWTDHVSWPGESWYFVVRGVNACVTGTSGWGNDSFGTPRSACP